MWRLGQCAKGNAGTISVPARAIFGVFTFPFRAAARSPPRSGTGIPARRRNPQYALAAQVWQSGRSEHEAHLGLMRMLSTPWETTRQASSKPTSNTGTAGFSSITHGRICPCQFTAKLHRPAWQLMSSARGSASSFMARLLLKRLCAFPHGRRHIGIDIHRRATLAGDFHDPCDVRAVLPRHARADAHVNSPLAQQADAAHRPVKAVRRMAQARIGRAIRLSFAYSVRKPG